MLDATVRRRIVDELLAADRERRTVPLLSARYPEMTIDDAYAVQSIWAEHRSAAGHRVVGHKVGLTSRAMQVSAGISEPDYGVIFEDMVFDNAASIQVDRYSNTRIEVELAFKLAKPLSGPGCTLFDVLDATAFVAPALELLNSHIEIREGRTIVDTISDNALIGAMVLGGRPVTVDAVDLRWAGALVYRNEIVEETGLAAGVLDHPARGVAWLANKLAQHGTGLEQGELILAGSFTRPMPVTRGDTVYADYGSLGSVTCRFV